MRKKAFFTTMLVAVVVLALTGSSVVLAKAHVPLGRAQICAPDGTARTIATKTLGKRLASGSCRLTACVFNDVNDDSELVQQFIFLSGDDCDPTDEDGDGFCDATGAPRSIPKALKANNLTPNCTDSH